MSANVEGTTGGLFQSPSLGVASRVFPKFHPGLRSLNAAEAVTGVKVPVQVTAAVLDEATEDVDIAVELVTVELVTVELVLVVVDRVVAEAELVALDTAAHEFPGMH